MDVSESMNDRISLAYEKLQSWCREQNYEGHDPFDGLNSRLFQSTPLRNSRIARLAWTQLFKRSPLNLRGVTGVPAEKNAKGAALFTLAALARFRTDRTKANEAEAQHFLDELMSLGVLGFSGIAWGYNFDWQGRAFFAPRGTPTIVPTAFAARALVEAALAFDDEIYLQIARSACDFILIDLNRSVETEEEVCWSYSPLDRTRVFNASLLAAETLATVSTLTGETELSELAVRGARYVARRQRPDGSWAYGEADFQSWSDNFHTAFILTSMSRIMGSSDSARAEFSETVKLGYEFWRKNFFLADGWPKYYHDRPFPVDVHSAAAAIVALLELHHLDDEASVFAHEIALWSINNLSDSRGYFYYQRHRFYTTRIPYIRWSQAWIMYALARLIEDGTVGREGGTQGSRSPRR